MAGPPVRERYNARARGSVAGGSHKKRRRVKNKEDGGEDREQHQQQQQEEGDGDGRGKMSTKKRKRMDSYINKKLKNEERLHTLKLLASLAPSSSTSAALASSASLGQNPLAPTSAMERSDKREDRLVRKGIDRIQDRSGLGESSGSDEEQVEVSRKGKGRAVEVVQEATRTTEDSMTKIDPKNEAKKEKSRSKKSNWNPNLLSTQPESESSDFDSSDSAYDSTTDDEDAKEGEQKGENAQHEAGTAKPAEIPPVPVGSALKSGASLRSGFSLKAGSTLETGSALKAPVLPATQSLGGALKKAADGTTVQPRVIPRRKKMPLGRRAIGEDDEDEDMDGDESGSDEDDEDDDGAEDDGDSEGSEEDDEDGSEGDDEEREPKKRSLGFKSWAMKQMGQTTDSPADTPSPKPEPPPFAAAAAPTKREPAPIPGEYVGPLGASFSIPTSSLLDHSNSRTSNSGPSARPTLNRRPSVAESRMELPILAEEQAIVESIRMNPVVIIAGETGSGKTTQVPQMLYEAGFGYPGSDNPGMIAVTQPRRVAAVSLSNRVRDELGFPPLSAVVAHQIRYSSTTSANTSIKFMTDGVLLRELSTDFLLSRYSVVIVDEAHERGVNTDVLIGVLSRVSKLREAKWRQAKESGNVQDVVNTIKPLRIVVMSATLRIEDFASNASLFAKVPPVIHIPARQHPVTMHFSRRTVGDYVGEAYKKVCKIHARLPPGAILVFLTGQGEIQQLCRRLEKKYTGGRVDAATTKKKALQQRSSNEIELTAEEQEVEDVELGQDEDLAADVDDGEAESDPEALDTDDEEEDDLQIDEATDAPMTVLPLYSLLSNEAQLKVFEPPPEGHRLVIVSTNVAETSLTIPGIRYVVDAGRAKERQYDIVSGVQSFQVGWISKASANQRAGRAGRTGPGHCYRLYSSALFEDHFEQFSKPEILRMPIEGVVLQMKSMNIDQVVNFPFPTPPDRAALAIAEKLLVSLGALSAPTQTRMVGGKLVPGINGGQITGLGKVMAGYPVSPRFGKMLAIGNQHGCLPFIVAIVAGLSVGDPFIHEQALDVGDDDEDEDEDEEGGGAGGRKAQIAQMRSAEVRAKEERKEMRKRFFAAQSRFLALGRGTSDLFKILAAIGAYEYDPTPSFCAKNFLRPKAMQEIQQLRHQISTITKAPLAAKRLTPPTDVQTKVIRQIVVAASLDKIAVRTDVYLKKNTAFASCRDVAYRAVGLGAEGVYIHPSSALYHGPPPEFIAFHEVTRSAGSGKAWVKGITALHPAWLATLGRSACSFSKPEVPPVGVKRAKGKLEEIKEGERPVLVTPHFADLGVDLPPVRMKQRREGTRWVLVE